MKRFEIIIGIFLVVALAIVLNFNPKYAKALKNTYDIHQVEFEGKIPKVKKLSEYKNTIFLPTLEHGINPQKNSVYCVTLLYAWEEVRKIINQPLIISEEYKDLLLLNNSKSYISVLKDNEYSTNVTIRENYIRARAEFYKSLPLGTVLNSYDNKLTFKGTPVASFGVNGDDNYMQQCVVKIIYYKNDDNFILKLLPKDKSHEIILFKTDKVFYSIAEMNEEIAKLTEIGNEEQKNEELKWKYYFATEKDEVIIPELNFNIETNYANLESKMFKTSNQNYKIDTAWQRTAFLLNKSGATIESEAEVRVALFSQTKMQVKPKKMIFDKDFLILLKRTDSQNPYFGLWVVNTELMKK